MSRLPHTILEEEGPNANAAVVWQEPPRWLPNFLHSLAYRNYLLLLIGQISNSLSLWMDLVARPVLVIAITGSAVQLGLITMVRGIPMMVLGPIAGLLADRMDRRVLMLISKVGSLVVNVGFVALIVSGQMQLWHVYATAILRSVLNAFDQPARQALLPALVPTRLLMNAVALNQGTMQVTRIASASAAGILITFWTVAFGFGDADPRAFGGVYLAIALVSIVAVVATVMLNVPQAGKVEHTRDSWATSFVQGFRFAWHNPVILGVLVLFAVQSTFGLPYLQVFVPWIAIKVMGMGPGGAGMLVAVSGVGSLLGAGIIAAKGHLLRRRGLIMIVGLALFGIALAALGLTSSLTPVTIMGLTLPLLPLIMISLVGIGQTVIMAMNNTILLESTPNELRGRVMSFQSLDRGFTTVGSGTGGFAIALVGGPIALALFGALCTLGAISVGVFSPGLRKHN